MEFLEIAAVVFIAFMALTVYQKIEAKKAEVQKQIAQAEAEAAINKSRIWANSKERQASIEAMASNYGFDDVPQFDINSILQFVGTPEGQQLLQNLLNKGKQ
jgi:hypothetical protein